MIDAAKIAELRSLLALIKQPVGDSVVEQGLCRAAAMRLLAGESQTLLPSLLLDEIERLRRVVDIMQKLIERRRQPGWLGVSTTDWLAIEAALAEAKAD